MKEKFGEAQRYMIGPRRPLNIRTIFGFLKHVSASEPEAINNDDDSTQDDSDFVSCDGVPEHFLFREVTRTIMGEEVTQKVFAGVKKEKSND